MTAGLDVEKVGTGGYGWLQMSAPRNWGRLGFNWFSTKKGRTLDFHGWRPKAKKLWSQFIARTAGMGARTNILQGHCKQGCSPQLDKNFARWAHVLWRNCKVVLRSLSPRALQLRQSRIESNQEWLAVFHLLRQLFSWWLRKSSNLGLWTKIFGSELTPI